MVITLDILPYICEHLTLLSDLSKLGRVNKSLHHQIRDCSHEHWLRIGRSMCGDAYWNAELFEHVLGRVDGRYTAMLHMCPWLSLPERFQLDTLKAYEYIGATVELQELKVVYTDDDEPSDASLQLLVNVTDNQHVKGGQRIVFRSARDAEATDTLHVLEDLPDPEEEDHRERAIMNQLQGDRTFMRCAERYGLGELARVCIVNRHMFAAIFDEGRTWRHSTILFISMHDHGRILHDLKFIDGAPTCVVFQPGELWYAESSGYVQYYGPRVEQELLPYTVKGDGRITRAFFAVVAGRAAEALTILGPMQLPDLNKIYIPKTTLTLFDVAADPDGRALTAREIEFMIDDKPPTTMDTSILDAPLPPDAALLLGVEPRFALGVHMMKRAIRAMDVNRICALVDAGCPWISHDDVLDALPPGLTYVDAMERLRLCRLRVTYRY